MSTSIDPMTRVKGNGWCEFVATDEYRNSELWDNIGPDKKDKKKDKEAEKDI